MPTQPCTYDKLIAQTLFLGASVSSFNTSVGWGSQASQITVNLIEDNESVPNCLFTKKSDPEKYLSKQFAVGSTPDSDLYQVDDGQDYTTFPDNHYEDCVGNNCYVNTRGELFTSDMRLEDRMIPGKVYYRFPYNFDNGPLREDSISNSSSYGLAKPALQSQYWYNPDPGFFGVPNRINPDNTYLKQYTNTPLNNGYDIIDTPVIFKMGDFSFGGIVQSWNRNLSAGGRNYSVTINSMTSVLNNCYIILSQYAGSIYSKLHSANFSNNLNTPDVNSIFGGPRNYTGNAGGSIDYFGQIYEGNLPNVFNVYGFLESMGIDNFGGSKSTRDGISANSILDALSVLTSSIPSEDGGGRLLKTRAEPSLIDSHRDVGKRTAFSPFGRILTKCMQENDTYNQITNAFNRFGVIPPTTVLNDETASSVTENIQSDRCQFVLDLSEIPRLPEDVRIPGPVISITDLINLVTEQMGCDYYVDLVPLSINRKLYNVIKIKIISRLKQPRQNEISNTIKKLQCNGYAISSATTGKEKNETNARSMIVGGPQQRLYQAKSYRLAYTQNNFIFNPRTYQFIDYMQMGTFDGSNGMRRSDHVPGRRQFHYGKIKIPTAFSVRNKNLSDIINPNYSKLYQHDEAVKKIIPGISNDFNETDSGWNDKDQILGKQTNKLTGNYGKGEIIKQEDLGSGAPDISTWGELRSQRYFPIHRDVICPFFGFVMDNELQLNTSGDNNDFRRIRPVWFDTWTGQLVIVLKAEELPVTSVNLEALYSTGTTYFLLTESEIRAAISGFDNFVVYCLSKDYKPDLIEMLRTAYVSKTAKQLKIENPSWTSEQVWQTAQEEHNWYWNLMNGNISGPFGNSIRVAPDKSDGSSKLGEEVTMDLQILHSFINEIAKYYGKKYMVMAPMVKSYRDDSFADIVLPTEAGDAYVFSGGGSLHYSYEPTNDGAWEEAGNIIDDTIPVGSKNGFALSDDVGKIKPILGYNASETFDYIRYNVCKMEIASFEKYKKDRANPYWSYKSWKFLLDKRDGQCNLGNFIIPSIDISSLNATDYVLTEVSGTVAESILPPTYNQYGTPSPAPFDPLAYQWTKTQARDPWGSGLVDINGLSVPIKKLYLTTTVDEKFIYLNPEKLEDPRILIESPGINLTSSTSSNQYVKDPNRTVISNVAIEDLAIYLKSTDVENWDYDKIDLWLYYITPVAGPRGGITPMKGNFAASANRASNHVEIAPKAAHPFFAGIPLKSNQYTYGPWTNYPYVDYLVNPESILPSGESIAITDSLPPTCTISPLNVSPTSAKKAINNWITPASIEIKDDFVPWNYGGLSFLDRVAFSEIETKINYQNIIETAQLEMPGLPIFNLGGSFSYGNFAFVPTGVYAQSFTYYDKKKKPDLLASLPADIARLYSGVISTTGIDVIIYKTIAIALDSSYNSGPIITNIQTNIGQGGISTTYSFRTYTRKLGLFNKENSDRIKKMAADNIKRNKQISSVAQQSANIINTQSKTLEEQRLAKANFTGKDLKSKLFGWSPSTVLIGQSHPYIEYIEPPKPNNTRIIVPIEFTEEFLGKGKDYTPEIKIKAWQSGIVDKALIQKGQLLVTLELYGKNFPIKNNEKAKSYIRAERQGIFSGDKLKEDGDTVVAGETLGNLLEALTLPTGLDPGDDAKTKDAEKYLTAEASVATLANTRRVKTSVGLYELKEVEAQLNNDYGLQSVMSIDGIFSPVSFYPTLKNSTYSFSVYDTSVCPFCTGTKKINFFVNKYSYRPAVRSDVTTGYVSLDDDKYLYCDKCGTPDEKLNVKLKGSVTSVSSVQSIESLPPYIITNSTDIATLLEFNSTLGTTVAPVTTQSTTTTSTSAAGVSIPINLVSLNPIVVPYSEFKNPNVQSYTGVYPYAPNSGIHGDLKGQSLSAYASVDRPFFDRMRHSIEIVGRGAVNPGEIKSGGGKTDIILHNNLSSYKDGHNLDFYHTDLNLQSERKKRENIDVNYMMNQRFLGLRGPLVLHGWGYDLEGYPVPNAADEPIDIDTWGRPKRFKIKRTVSATLVAFKDIKDGESYQLKDNTSTGFIKKEDIIALDNGGIILRRDPNSTANEPDWSSFFTALSVSGPNELSFKKVTFEDDLTVMGGFMDNDTPAGAETYKTNRTVGYQGSIISKTQKWTPDPKDTNKGKWSAKKKLGQFYLNWAERTDLWPVGPIDLRWDESRKVWATKSDSAASIYKMVYVTLEEDLVKDENMDETYPTRGFLDDLEYSTDPLEEGYRRLVYVKDRVGYTAPRGAKILCRYDKDSGFYEPVSKPSYVTKGTITAGSSQASIELTFVQGRKRGESIPTMLVNFDNPFSLSTSGGVGLFTFINGKWTLTTSN